LIHTGEDALRRDLANLVDRADAAQAIGKAGWGSAFGGTHSKRDLIGGVLPAAFHEIFGEHPIAKRDRFITAWCDWLEVEIGTPKPGETDEEADARRSETIKQHVTRFKQARAKGGVGGLPPWMEPAPQQ
jgi:hypothetical protein